MFNLPVTLYVIELYAQIDIYNHEEIAKDPQPWRSWSFMELNTNDRGLSFLQEPKRFVSMTKTTVISQKDCI